MKYKLVLLLVLGMILKSVAQQFPANWCNEYTVKRVKGNQQLTLPACDSVWILNRKTFSVYRNTYDSAISWGNQSGINYRMFINKARQDSIEYDALHKQFDKLMNKSNAFVDSTNNVVDSLRSSIVRVDAIMDSTSKNIEETKKIIKKQQKLEFERKLLWGISGAAIGILLGILFF